MNNDLIEFALLTLMFVGMGSFVHLFTRVFKFVYKEQSFLDVKKSSISALITLALGWVAVSGLFLLFTATGISSGNHQEFHLENVIRQLIVSAVFFGPCLIMMRVRHETWATSGITKLNIGKSFLLGIVLSTFIFLFNIITKHLDLGQVLHAIISPSKLWALATFLVVGISEEFGFRGYLQTRLVLWLGKTWGWLLASTLMALGHIIQRMAIMGMSGVNALLSSLALIPISLLFGYIMLRTENIVAGALLHAFIGWNSVF